LLLNCTVSNAITGKIVIDSFNECRSEYGTPISIVIDNGNVATARFSKGKNGSPGHPQTQGKIERFHQTWKKWLSAQKAAENLKELQRQLDGFRTL